MNIELRYYSRSYSAAQLPLNLSEVHGDTYMIPGVDTNKLRQFRQLVPRLLAMARQTDADILIEEKLSEPIVHVVLEGGELLLFPVGDSESFSTLAELAHLASALVFDARHKSCRVEIWVALGIQHDSHIPPIPNAAQL